jgi:hypothetical protein
VHKEGAMKTIIQTFTAILAIVLAECMAHGAESNAQAPEFFRVNIKSGYLVVRDIPSVKGGTAGVFYAGDDCVPALGGSKKDGGRIWIRVFNPYLRAAGWVDSKFVAPTKSNCDFEKFLYNTRGKTDWVFDHMTFPLVISSPNVEEEPPSSYSKEEVLSSTKNLYEGPYYYLQLLDDRGMEKFWAERDGCAKYELLENSKFDVNSYVFYTVTKTAEEASITISCLEMYPEFKFKKSKDGYILTGILDSGS